MKNLYKLVLKKINNNNTDKLFSDLSSIIYKLGYNDVLEDIDSNILAPLIAYSQGDNGKFYTGVKKWVKSINTDKGILEVFNICNLGMRVGLGLDTVERERYSKKSKMTLHNFKIAYKLNQELFESNPIYKVDKDREAILPEYVDAYGLVVDVDKDLSKGIPNNYDMNFLYAKLSSSYPGRAGGHSIDVSEVIAYGSDIVSKYNKFLEQARELPVIETYDWEALRCINRFMEDETSLTEEDTYLLRDYINNLANKNSSNLGIYRDLYFMTEYVSYLQGDEFVLGFASESSDIDVLNGDLFYLCLGLKLSLLNNNSLKLDDFKLKMDCDRFVSYIDKNHISMIDKVMTDKGSDTGVKQLFTSLINNTGDIDFSEFLDCVPVCFRPSLLNGKSSFKDNTYYDMGIVWASYFINFCMASIQDKNIPAYMDFISDSTSELFVTSKYSTDSTLFSNCMESIFDSLYSRKYIIPVKGIVAEFGNKSIYLREFDNILGEHCISAIFRGGDYSTVLINMEVKTITGINISADDMAYILKVLECDNIPKYWLESVVKLSDSNRVDDMLNLDSIEIPSNILNGNVDILSPYYWRYRGEYKAKAVLSEHSPVTSDKEIIVNAFVRRLPNGGTASKERQDIARRYCIKLEDGYTIVDSFTRKSVEGSTRTMSSFGDMT